MKTNLKCLSLSLFLLIYSSLYAQVGIGTTSPDQSSILDIVSDSKGFLMPRLSTVKRDAIVLPASGLMIYNSTLNDGQVNAGTDLVPIWMSITQQDGSMPMIDAITDGVPVSTRSINEELITGMTLSPNAGDYMVLFNAQLLSSATFSSDQGVTDSASLYDQLMAVPNGVSHGLTFGNSEVLLPGVYDVAGAPSISGTLTLDAGGDASALFIIRGTGAFTTGTFTEVVLAGNAAPENIFWVSNAAMSTGANTIMKGTMLGGGNAAGAVSLGADSSLNGRLLTKLGAASVGANVVLTSPTGSSLFDLGVLSTFAMWSSAGAVSDVASATITGDVGTAAGALTVTGTHIGEEFPAGTTSNASTSTYTIYHNDVAVNNSSRTLKLQSAIVSLQAMVNTNSGDTIEVRWKVDEGEATLTDKVLSLVRY